MKNVLLFPLALLLAVVVNAQSISNPEASSDAAKTYQEVYSIHQSLALAYLRSADPQDFEVFYGEGFRLSSGKNSQATRQQMEATMKALVAERILTQGCLMQQEPHLLMSKPNMVVVSGTWKAAKSSQAGKHVPYAFTYSRRNGVWKLTDARFVRVGQALAAGSR